jgi:enoyl-CoA hydratase
LSATGRVESETVFHEPVADGVVLVTMNRPEQGNGVVPELMRDLLAALTSLEADRSVRCLVLTGAGRQFSAGADLKAMRRYLDEELQIEHEPYNARVLFPVTQRIVASRLPVVAAINGGATAGGLDLALACDLRVCSSQARLGETYINLGLPPGNGGSWFLPRIVGAGHAAELALTGDLIDAARALQIGLVNRVVEPDELIPAAVALADQIAAKAWRAAEATKQALRASWQVDLATAMNFNYYAVATLQHTEDVSEGVNAFLERRPAVFNRAPRASGATADLPG